MTEPSRADIRHSGHAPPGLPELLQEPLCAREFERLYRILDHSDAPAGLEQPHRRALDGRRADIRHSGHPPPGLPELLQEPLCGR